MKKLFISLLLVLPFLFSCQPQVDPYTAGEEEVSGCYGVYFPSQEATGSHTLDPTMAPQTTFTAMRKNTSGAITVPLTVKASADGVFNVGALSFADGQSESTFTVEFPNSELGTTYNLSISIDDPQYASKYQNQPVAFDYSCLRVEWKYVLNPKTGEKAKIHWTQDWWGEEVDTYIKYYEVGGVRTCRTETIADSHLYKGEYYTGYGFFGKSEAEGDGEWSFIWYPQAKDANGNQYIHLLSQYTGYYNSNYNAEVWVYDGYGMDADYRGKSVGSFLSEVDNYGYGYYDGNGGFYLYTEWYYMDGVGGWNVATLDNIGIAEGFTRVDYSIEAKSDYSHNGEVPVYLTLGVDVAKIQYAAYPGELSAAQVENKVAAITSGADPSETITEFEEEDGKKYADFGLSFGETGFYTFVAVTFDENGKAQNSASVLLNYVSADDEELYQVIVDCGIEEVPARYTGFEPTNSFAFFVKGEDLKEAHVSIYTASDYEEKRQLVLNDIKTKHKVDSTTLAQINANGGFFTVVSGLKPETEYVLLVWATNGKEEGLASDSWKTDAMPYVWKELGKGEYTDDVACGIYENLDPITVSCDVFEEESHPGLYKISGFQLPLTAAIFNESEEEMMKFENGNWRNSEIIIDATNPEDVRISLQDYGVCLNPEDGFIDGITSILDGKPYSVGTLADGVITFPKENGLLATIGGEGFYFANQHGAFKLVLPGAIEENAAPANVSSNFKKGTKATKQLCKARGNFERGDVKAVNSVARKIEHKSRTNHSREISKN